MKKPQLFLMRKFLKNRTKGFILPFAILIATLVLAISIGVSSTLVKEILFSNLNRESAFAYFAADAAIDCALSMEGEYIDHSTGYGIFPYDKFNNYDATTTFASINTNDYAGVTNFSSSTVYCAGVPLFNSNVTHFKVTDYPDDGTNGAGKTSDYDMKMDLGDGTYRCAHVTVNKTTTWRQIIARGFNTCDISGPNVLERAVVNTTEI